MNDTTVSPLTLRVNLAEYPSTSALRSGAVRSPLIEFDFCGPETAHNGFKAMLRENAFDAGELAIVTYLQAIAYNKPFVMLPAPVSGRQQHHCAGYNSAHNSFSPKDIEGKRVGVRSYAQTTGLWIRGILQHEYGVDLDKVTWLTVIDGHLSEYADPPNCTRLPKGSDLGQMLLDGEIDASLLGNDMPADPRIKTLVPDAIEAGKAWYAREGVIPINHVFVVHRDLTRKRPDVVREIYRLLVESRAQSISKAPLPPFGLEANRKGLTLAIDWAFEQKIIPRRLAVDELFDDVTASLGA
ncbi:phosphate ABC transporter substrate-binding protein [Sinorhizobium meliloti]|uniref:phosphate ABC transporter substrate-binding protein n=1 Tax=Rhizobium meliloti TaxID=382 RepID=UPI0012962FB3|nr:phosphate ABC transporter substrate-binding protein [Sinorhizobium meliloti]MQU72459.1 phosphate ABC transporter substrate-binding protein [Sinorhizobium meliloti]